MKKYILSTYACLTLCFAFSRMVVAAPPARETKERIAARQLYDRTVQAYLQDKDNSKARMGFIESLEKDPSFAMPRYKLAKLAESEEKWDDAKQWYQQILQVDPLDRIAEKAQQELD